MSPEPPIDNGVNVDAPSNTHGIVDGSRQSGEEPNAYLALRAAKIAKNDARLAELGLLRPLSQAADTSYRKTTRRKQPQSTVSIDTSCLRRSPRHTHRPGTYAVPDIQEPKRKRSKVQHAEVLPVESTKAIEIRSLPPNLSQKSVRHIRLNVSSLCQDLLGKSMEHTGKAHVVEESVHRASSSDASTHGLSFNKYSGVQEWNNDALYLWVNLGGKGDVINDFMDGGRQMTWFGGSRMHDESNVILRLLRVGQLSRDGRLPPTDGIVLWCRRYCQEERSHGPYVCLGRLAYHSHVPGSRPLQFVWTLLDQDKLLNHEETAVQDTFRSMVA